LIWSNLAIEAYYSPASTIGGDFGVVLPHGDELSLLVCDVSGHGICSALVASRIYSQTLHELKRDAGLSSLLGRLHTFVHDYIGLDGFYFTMAAGRFVQRGRRLTFAAAGHPPGILISNGTLRLLDSQSAILGSVADVTPSESVDEIDLASGDRLVLYTDGFIEVFNRSDEMLGVDGLEDLIRRSAKRTVAEMQQAILSGVTAWRNGGPLTDDMSLVIVEVR
jgi:sigma-B regulation protein RsbU (phosphoserine phosphatase)